jgi:LTXXQ motif family protein
LSGFQQPGEVIMKRFDKLLVAGGMVAAIGAGAAIAQNIGGASGENGPLFEQTAFHMGPMGGRFMERLCAPEGPPNGERMVDMIAGRLRVTDAQKPALTGLQESIAKAFTDAKALCAAKPDETTPSGKLTAAEKRLEVLLSGLKIVHPKLDAFYATLDETQKAKFNAMGPGEHHGWGHGGGHGWGERMRGWFGHGPDGPDHG